MAVPDTTTFSLQDVVDEINPTTDDLNDCVSDATTGSYDTNYFVGVQKLWSHCYYMGR